jgi:hypothetical protein
MDALSGIKGWAKTLKLLKDKVRKRNPQPIESSVWRFSAEEQLFYGPNDKHKL